MNTFNTLCDQRQHIPYIFSTTSVSVFVLLVSWTQLHCQPDPLHSYRHFQSTPHSHMLWMMINQPDLSWRSSSFSPRSTTLSIFLCIMSTTSSNWCCTLQYRKCQSSRKYNFHAKVVTCHTHTSSRPYRYDEEDLLCHGHCKSKLLPDTKIGNIVITSNLSVQMLLHPLLRILTCNQ